MVAPHFTFVFPFAGTGVDDAISHAAHVTRTTAPIQFRLTETAVVRDTFGPATHLFLLPGHGAGEMRDLHARLYAGVLAAHRNPEIPFLPHVTVGAFEQEADAATAAGNLGKVDVPGTLTALSVAEFDGRAVVDVCELPLLG